MNQGWGQAKEGRQLGCYRAPFCRRVRGELVVRAIRLYHPPRRNSITGSVAMDIIRTSSSIHWRLTYSKSYRTLFRTSSMHESYA